MKVVDTFYKKEFIASSEKKSFLKAMRFLFKTFFSECLQGHKIENLSIYLDKEFTGGYKMVVEIGCEVDIKEELRKKCLRCEEAQKLPWYESNALDKCNTCKCNWLLSQTQSKLNVKKGYLRERVEYLINKVRKYNEQ